MHPRRRMLLSIKCAAATLLDRAGVLGARYRRNAPRGGLILGFHRVLPAAEIPECYDRELAITDTVFEEMLQLLRNEFHVVSLDELAEEPESHNKLQRVALTFDDGWEDTYRVALPLLRKYDAKATVFLCTDLMDGTGMLPEERFARIWRWCAARNRTRKLEVELRERGVESPGARGGRGWGRALKKWPIASNLRLLTGLESRYQVPEGVTRKLMTWEEARAMQREGIRFGSHTARHATLAAEPEDSLMMELRRSREAIEDAMQRPCVMLAYPNGGWNRHVADAARAAGYQVALTIDRGLWRSGGDPLAMPRVCLADSLLTDARGRLHSARARLAMTTGSGGAAALSDFHLRTRSEAV